jgi:scyllo-inosamine-4-phosphate amidinotransferase 1
MKVFTKNEYSLLRSIIVGSANQSSWPLNDLAFDNAIESSNVEGTLTKGLLPTQIIKEAEEDLEKLVEVLEKNKVKVYRPQLNEPNWSYSARDILLSVGKNIIECPTQYLSRRDEAKFYQHVKASAITDGCKWIKAPEPNTDDDPMFDAANICKFDDKLLYLVSSTGNRAGAEWLQQQVGTEFEVIMWEGVYASAHIDSTIASLNKNTIMLNASRVSYNNLPLFLRQHRKIWINDIVARDFYQFPFASKWIGLNVLSIDPETIIVDSIQTKLIERLKDARFKVIELELRQSRTLGGGFHCVTCDLERECE